MSRKRRLTAVLIFAALALPTVDVGEQFLFRGELAFTTPAEARIGRPLTPVSVAGVARRTSRRTVRRCAAGVTC